MNSGYKLIIVLSGIMEDLRSQTQKRIESDVIGEGRNEETNVLGRKGVGEMGFDICPHWDGDRYQACPLLYG